MSSTPPPPRSTAADADPDFKRIASVLKHHASGRHPHYSLHLDHTTHDEHKHLDGGSHEHAEKHDSDVKPTLSGKEIMDKAVKRALGGGLTGAAAMFAQVGALMWMRTTMNYQYRNGGTTMQAWKTLYGEGGIGRFYRGVGPALFQGPLSRFGDTAANAGILALLASYDETRDMPTVAKTMCASGAAAMWRINLMPIDTLKTTMQVQGKDGISKLKSKFAKSGPRVLYHGSLGAFAATYVGHFPWFATFNFLDANLPKYDETFKKFGRNAVMGFCSSAVSDTCSNSIRVLKTTRQTYETPISYGDAAKQIIAKDGLMGLFGRGLQTRILANGMQGMLFTIIWKGLQEQYNKRNGLD
jgi:hypothetical protein